MIKSYPRFKRGEVNKIFKKLSKVEQDKITKYVNRRGISIKSQGKLEDKKRHYTQFLHIFQKPLNEIDLNDLREFLVLLNQSGLKTSYKNDLKEDLKDILKEENKDWSMVFDNFRDVKTEKPYNPERINSKVILQKDDIEKIVKTETRIYWKAFFLTLYESGFRPKELRTLKWNDITFDVEEDLTEINIIASKTNRARVVYVKESTYYLKRLRDEQEMPRTKEIMSFQANET